MIEKEISLGRAPDNDIVISDPTVSSYHAKIFITHEGFEIKDLESSNGTRVNGKVITKTEIMPSDNIKLGSYEISKETMNRIFTRIERTKIMTDLRPNLLQRNTKSLKIAVSIGFLLILLILSYLFILPKVKPRKLSPSTIFQTNKENTVLVQHRYIGQKGDMYLCSKSPLLEAAAEEKEIPLTTFPNTNYAILPDRQLAEQFAFEKWGTGILLSEDGKILTYRTLADPVYCLDPYQKELVTFFDGISISIEVWQFGMNTEKSGTPANHIEFDYIPEDELSLLKLERIEGEISYLSREKIGALEKVEVLSPIVAISYNPSEGVEKAGKIVPISASGKVSGVVDNFVKYSLEENTILSPGAPIFDLRGNLIGLNGNVSAKDGFGYGINPEAFIQKVGF